MPLYLAKIRFKTFPVFASSAGHAHSIFFEYCFETGGNRIQEFLTELGTEAVTVRPVKSDDEIADILDRHPIETAQVLHSMTCGALWERQLLRVAAKRHKVARVKDKALTMLLF